MKPSKENPKENPPQRTETPTRSAGSSRPWQNEDPAEGADFSKEENASRLDHEEGDSAGMPPRKTRKGETLH